MFIHFDEIQQHTENNVGVVKTGQHYDLLKQIIDVDDMPCNDEEKGESNGDSPQK